MKWSEYRRNKEAEVIAPSGLKYKIKPISVKVGLMLLNKHPAEQARIALLHCVVEPPLSEKPDEEHVGLDEIPQGDAYFLVNEIVKISGLEELESFRELGIEQGNI